MPIFGDNFLHSLKSLKLESKVAKCILVYNILHEFSMQLKNAWKLLKKQEDACSNEYNIQECTIEHFGVKTLIA